MLMLINTLRNLALVALDNRTRITELESRVAQLDVQPPDPIADDPDPTSAETSPAPKVYTDVDDVADLLREAGFTVHYVGSRDG